MSERAWMDPADDPRHTDVEPPRGELAVLRSYLHHYRLTLELKLDGLDAEQLATRSVPPSTMSLLGLLRHLALVEHHWFQRALQGVDEPQRFTTPEDHDAEFNAAVADPVVVEEAWRVWRQDVATAETYLDGLTDADLSRLVGAGDQQGEVRDILVHLVEEYARHLGHVDLLRECLDGRTGE